jgi:hypothetical protein
MVILDVSTLRFSWFPQLTFAVAESFMVGHVQTTSLAAVFHVSASHFLSIQGTKFILTALDGQRIEHERHDVFVQPPVRRCFWPLKRVLGPDPCAV